MKITVEFSPFRNTPSLAHLFQLTCHAGTFLEDRKKDFFFMYILQWPKGLSPLTMKANATVIWSSSSFVVAKFMKSCRKRRPLQIDHDRHPQNKRRRYEYCKLYFLCYNYYIRQCEWFNGKRSQKTNEITMKLHSFAIVSD